MSECKKIRRLLTLHPADWSPAEQEMVETHLAACPSCAALKEECAGQGRLLRTLPAAEMTPIQQRDLFARMAKAKGKHVVGSRWSLVWGVAAGLVVLLALAALFSLLLQRTGRLPTGNRTPTAGVSPQPTGTLPAGVAELRGLPLLPISDPMGAIQTFRVRYANNTWQREQSKFGKDELHHRALPDCVLYPSDGFLASGTFNEHITLENSEYIEGNAEQVTLGDYEFRRTNLNSSDQTLELISYDLVGDKFSFVFGLRVTGLEPGAVEHCRTDAETVLSTLVLDEAQQGPFAITLATLAVSENPGQWSRDATSALQRDMEAWLEAGNDPAGLREALSIVPLIDPATVEVNSTDLDGDGRNEVVLRGLWGNPLFTICKSGSFGTNCSTLLSFWFPEEWTIVGSALIPQELNGVGGRELIITTTIMASEGARIEDMEVFSLDDDGDPFQQIFMASLEDWAGPARWKLEPDPTAPGQQQFVLTAPHIYGNGFEDRQLNHPLERQVWRWNWTDAQFALAEEEVDTERSGRGVDVPVTAGDRLWWKTNEAETAFRGGDYEAALERYEQIIVLAEGWTPSATEPDWAAYARFRRGECLALLGRAGEGRAELSALAEEYRGDMLGTLAASFLAAYGGGSAPDAAARGVAALPTAELYAHFSAEGSGSLQSPLNAPGILFPGAGLVDYLNAHPELTADMTALQAGLQEAGFAAEQVQQQGEQLFIMLRLPQAPEAEGKLFRWRLEHADGHWRIAPFITKIAGGIGAVVGLANEEIWRPKEIDETAPPTPGTTPAPTPTASPSPMVDDPLANSRRIWESRRLPADGPLFAASLAEDIAAWLNRGNDPSGVGDLVWALPEIEGGSWGGDLNLDGRWDVQVQIDRPGVPVIVCLSQDTGKYLCSSLPETFAGPVSITADSTIYTQDLNCDGSPETIITYTVQISGGWAELLYVYRWDRQESDGRPLLAFHATLLDEAGPSRWYLDSDPAAPGCQQIVLTFPYRWFNGFDDPKLNHPAGRQVWRIYGGVDRFELAEQSVDLEHSASGAQVPVTAEDAQRWQINQAETAFRAGDYQAALERYTAARDLAVAPGPDLPDWTAYARFRRGECLALLGRADEARAELAALAEEYEGDMLGTLAASFLAAYGDGSAPNAAARGVAALPAADLYAHFSAEGGGALRFPMDAAGVLYPGAGLAAYLDAHPELVTDTAALRAGLQEAGFAAQEVLWEGETLVVVLQQPELAGVSGAPAHWRLENGDGAWRVTPLDPGQSEQWPTVGGLNQSIL